MNKHAYLIMAHKNWEQFLILLKLLDDKRNDIYIHVDKKSNFTDEQKNFLVSNVKASTLYFVKRTMLTWGGYSSVSVEMNLLREAVNNDHYSYYHLLSGQDLPLKNQDYIHSYFDSVCDKELINFGTDDWINLVSCRLKLFWFFQNLLGRSRNIFSLIIKAINKLSISIQRLLKINRIKGYTFCAGSQWFSITDKFARYMLSQNDFIHKTFKFTLCGDECLTQFLAYNSSFRDKLLICSKSNSCLSNMRYIDWKRGSPYTFVNDDFEELINSGCLFARKFDMSIDDKIVYRIYNYLNSM